MDIDRRAALLLAPFGFAAIAGVAFWRMLAGMQKGTFDPRGVPTMLRDQKVPIFELPGLDGPGFTAGDLSQTGGLTLINFFASWCPPCVEEAPELLVLKQRGIAIWGIAYKDVNADTRAFLDRQGNPYARIAVDAPGRVAIDWGVTGVPESFLIDAQGIVRWHMAGPLVPDTVRDQLNPALKTFAS